MNSRTPSINFTGLKWCGYCIQLERETLSNDAFARRPIRSYSFASTTPAAANGCRKSLRRRTRPARRLRHQLFPQCTLLTPRAGRTPQPETSA